MNLFRRNTAGSTSSSDTARVLGDKRRLFQKRTPTMPFEHTTRKKPRRWPLAFRFIKGAIHSKILVPVAMHAIFCGLVVWLDYRLGGIVTLPSSIIPSLSIVVGLMLVFRNQTSYNRFWEGRCHLTTIITSVRNLSRTFLVCSYNSNASKPNPDRAAEHADTERAVKLLVALLYATKNHLRADWGAYSDMASYGRPLIRREVSHDYDDLVPQRLMGHEQRGLGVALEFAALLEAYIKRGADRNWWHAPQSSQLSVQVNTMIDAYGKMETIRLTPVPVAHLIHQKQVLALFGAVLPFAMVTDPLWWAIPINALVMFALYGIEGIASELEDPFGYDHVDIPMDAIVEDIRVEQSVMMDEWRRVTAQEGVNGHGEEGGRWFVEDTPAPTPTLRSHVRFED